MVIFVPYLAFTSCFALVGIISLFIPPALSTNALALTEELIASNSLPLVMLGKILLWCQMLDIILTGLYLKAFKLCISMMPFAFIFLLWKLLTL